MRRGWGRNGAVLDRVPFSMRSIRCTRSPVERPRAPGPWAEPKPGQGLADVVAAHEADLGQEVGADGQVLQFDAVAVAGVIQLGAVARVLGRLAWRAGARPVGVDAQVVEEREGAVGAVDLVVGPADHLRAVGGDDAEAASAQDFPAQPHDREVGAANAVYPVVVGGDVQQARC